MSVPRRLFRSRKSACVVATMVIACSVGLVPARADATADRYTQGDAEAVLQAYPPAGGAISLHAPHVDAGPSLAYASDGLSIRPINPFFSEARYCVEDWHAIALTAIDFEFVAHFEEPLVYTKDDALNVLGGVEMRFLLDGLPVDGTTQGPIKPYSDRSFLAVIEAAMENDFGVDVTIGRAWAVQAGRPVAPDALSLGQHTLTGIVTDPVFGSFEDTITFYVDPPESDTCTAR
jgi:hypothetical protein